MIPRSLLIALVVGGLGLSATIVPGVFTIDEDNYLITVVSLREGGLTVPGTEGLTPSPELIYFDPQGLSRQVTETPVSSTAPPLYAPFALPFAVLGWRGLVALQTLSFLIAVAIVFVYARRYAESAHTPWLAAAAFALGGYALEYAQGLWPHMLALALGIGAAYLAARVRDGGALALALAAGVAAGIAAGIRYQNFVLAGCIGLTLLVLCERRIRASLLYGVGTALPLATSAAVNYWRLGSWNPISKGPGYLSIGGAQRQRGLIVDTLAMGWARLVDFTVRPPLTGTHHEQYLRPDPATGAYLIGSAVKKAWLQSAPWIVLALAVCVAVWLVGARRDESRFRRDQRRELRAVGLVVFPVLAMFAVAGVYRTDGLCFNQRYFLELVPFVALAFAWSLDRLEPDRRWLLLGALVGLAGAGLALAFPGRDILRTVALMRAPLVLAVLLLAAWLVFRRRPGSARAALALTLLAGAALGWALAVHIGDDLPASRFLRRWNLRQSQAYAAALPPAPEPVALFAWGGIKDAIGPLQLERDLVGLDALYDRAETMPVLIDELLAAGRRVLVVASGFRQPALATGLAGRRTRVVSSGPVVVLEVEPGDTGEDAAGGEGG